ncbi:MAG TPA: acetoacetate--CoA ligase [Casimicrobiaceae bacterium]|nr:acetoacetate--CoA ligase [Casimicrobiaceae bacterium]
MPASATPLWSPSADRVAAANLTAFAARLGARHGVELSSYDTLWRWSIDHKADFWREIWDDSGVMGSRGDRIVVDPDKMPGAAWFPDASLNFAQNLLERKPADDASDALVFWGEDKVRRRVSHLELHALASRAAAAFAAHGIVPGDRVAGYVPNIPEAVIAMLGAVARGATWSSCSPEFGVQGVLDRFSQIGPRVLITVDGYFYNDKVIPILDKVAAIVERMPSVEKVIVIPYVQPAPQDSADLARVRGAVAWEVWLAPFLPGPIDYVSLPFAHPLYILYSSGTTGAPKCIVHTAGGVLLQHLKEHRLHGDVKRGDRMFYFTTCGWMMWNWLVTGLASGATLLLYDGSPFIQQGRVLWKLAALERMTHFGTSARFIDSQKKIARVPRKDFDLSALRVLFSTGSALSGESFDYVYQCVKEDLCLSSISGGTDIASCFALGAPTLPVWRGELQCRGLGMDVDIFDDDGTPVTRGKGELVCKSPFPAMPAGFWNDPDGEQYRAAYFERFPGVWRQGDWAELTEHGGMIFYGRSDATLNPGGVRIGTAEIYQQVEALPEVAESLVIGQAWPPGECSDVRIVLFVVLQDGLVLDDALAERIRQTIRTNTTPRHVPSKILQVTEIPRTRSGKLVELAVSDVVHGRDVRNVESLANPEALESYRDLPELKR